MVRHEVENYVVLFSIARKILSSVINDVICADGADHFHIPRTANAGNLSAKRFGDLYSERTHASGGAIDQDLLARLNLSLVAKTLQGGESRHRRRARLLKRHVMRLHRQCRLAGARILCKRPRARAEHLVARLELRNVPADSFDLARYITPWSCDFLFGYRGQHTTEKRVSEQVVVKWID